MRTAQNVAAEELAQLEPASGSFFGGLPREKPVNERSMRLYLAIKKLVAQAMAGISILFSPSPAWPTTTPPRASPRA